MAKIELARLTHCKVDKEYYKGKFKHIAGNIWFFEYDNTYQASDAVLSDHNVVMTPLPTNEILPPVELFLTIRLDIICISKEESEKLGEKQGKRGMKRGMELGMKWVLDQLDDKTKKKIKLDFEGPDAATAVLQSVIDFEGPDAVTAVPQSVIDFEGPDAATAVPQPVVTVPDEDAMSDNIIAQINTFAESEGLKFYRNVAKITKYGVNKFTKYGHSRPDAASHYSLLTTEDHSAMTFFIPAIVAMWTKIFVNKWKT